MMHRQETVECLKKFNARRKLKVGMARPPSPCPHVPVGPILKWKCQWDLETRRKENPPNLRLLPSPDQRVPDAVAAQRVRALPGCRAGHFGILRTVLAQSGCCKRQS